MKKRMSLKHILGFILAATVFISCSKSFLERPPVDAITDANFYKNDEQVLAASSSLYNRVWFSYNDQAGFALGDVRGGTFQYPWGGNFRAHVLLSTTADNPHLLQTWNSFFAVIAQSNLFLYNVERFGGPAITPSVKKACIAEARYMRALAYRYLVLNFGPVPVIENNFEKLYDTSITRNTETSIWRFLTREMKAAAADLPSTSLQEGRLTKWSAEGMLARFYLTRAGVESTGGVRNQSFLDSAKYYAQRVITQSGRQLLPVYADLFKFPYDNNRESLFELQWVFTGGTGTYGVGNSSIDQMSPSNELAFQNWGGSFGATWWMMSLYEGFVPQSETVLKGRTLDQRLKATFLLPGFEYPEALVESTGLPYVHPATTGADYNVVGVKKYMVGKSNLIGKAAQQNYPQNTYMQRLAEMYLIYAEAEIGNNASTTNATAISYISAIRNRAGLGDYEVSGPGGQGPLTLDEVFKERFKEFAMEGMAWYDLVSLHYYNPQKAYAIINAQDRGLFLAAPNVMPNPSEWTLTKTAWVTERHAVASSANFRLPLPATEVAQAPNLNKPPVDYP